MVDAASINQSATRIAEIIQENIPTADLRKGSVLREIFVQSGAFVRAALQEQIDSLEQNNSLKAIEENIDTASPNSVEAVVSNWFVERKQGTISLGSIKVSVNTKKQYFIPIDVPFTTTSGLNYFALEGVTIPEDEVFEDTVSGTFYFLVSVQAEAAGSEYDIEAGTQLQTNILTGSLILISAYNDFFNGSDTETSTDLIARGKTLLSTRDLVSRTSINAFMADNFTDIIMTSVTGFQNIEMQRGKNSLGIKSGGPVDIYIKTNTSVNSKEIEVTTDSNGEFTVPSADYPILRVQDFVVKTSPLDRIQVTDLIVNTSEPSIDPIFARFTQYETIKVNTGMPNEDIIYTINTHPNIKVVDDFINADDKENLCTSTLVKTFIPVFVSTNITFSVKDGSDVADDDTIKQSLCDFINSVNSGFLFISEMIDVFHNFNITNIELPLDVTGIAFMPDGSTRTTTSNNKLYFESDIDLQFSENTYRFYCVKNDIQLNREIQ